MTKQEPLTPPLLSHEDRIEVFKIATRSLVYWHGAQFEVGMNDKELEAALEEGLGIFGGTGSRNSLHVTYKGAGLKIWGGWHIVNHVQEVPLFQGKATIAMARKVYAIADPDDGQMNLFLAKLTYNNRPRSNWRGFILASLAVWRIMTPMVQETSTTSAMLSLEVSKHFLN